MAAILTEDEFRVTAQQLFEDGASQDDRDALVESIVHHPEFLEAEMEDGATFIHECCFHSCFDILDAAAGRGVTIPYEARDDKGSTPLLDTLFRSQWNPVKELLQRGTNAEATMHDPGNLNRHGQGVFHVMRGVEDMPVETGRLLAEAGADVNARNAKGMTALKHALKQNNEEKAVYLMQAGARAKVSTARIREPGFAEKAADAFFKRHDLKDDFIITLDDQGDVPEREDPLVTLTRWLDKGAKTFLRYEKSTLDAGHFLEPNGRLKDESYALLSLGLLDKLFTPERFDGLGKMLETAIKLPVNARRAINLIDDERDSPLARPGSAVERYVRGGTGVPER